MAVDSRQRRPELTPLPSVVFAEPPPRPEPRPPERAMVREELAILDRAADYELEYYDDAPARRRRPKRMPFVVAFVAAVGVLYLFAASRLAPRRSAPVTREGARVANGGR